MLVNKENRGKGYSVRKGVLEARGRWVLMSDADLSTPIAEHARLADRARDRDADVVIGSRGLDESNIEVRQNVLREMMGKTFNKLSKLITGSEGTLATTLDVKINLEPLPAHKSVCVVHFAELLEAIRAVEPMLEFTPSAVEILDERVGPMVLRIVCDAPQEIQVKRRRVTE